MSKPDVALSDAEIRPALRSYLRTSLAQDANTVVVEELGLCRGQVRVDLALVNGLLHGYEIKSDRDTLRRLERQVEVYGKVLDRATLVAGDRHLAEALPLVPAWWGVLRFYVADDGRPRFKPFRKGCRNPAQDPRSLVELLWLDDALALLAGRDVVRGVRGKPRLVVWDRVCEYFHVDEIANAVRTQLKSRTTRQVPPLPS